MILSDLSLAERAHWELHIRAAQIEIEAWNG